MVDIEADMADMAQTYIARAGHSQDLCNDLEYTRMAAFSKLGRKFNFRNLKSPRFEQC